MFTKNCNKEVPLASMNYDQASCLRESMRYTFLLIWKGVVTDYINIFNQFLMFSEIPRLFQGMLTVGGGITSVPLDFKVPKDYYYHCKILNAIKNHKVTLVCLYD